MIKYLCECKLLCILVITGVQCSRLNKEDFNLKAYFKSLEWKKGSRELVQGVKGNRVPYNAISGGNGSFICSTPAELILTVTTEDGRKVSKNIVSIVRNVNGWSRLTNNRVDLLESKLRQAYEFSLDNREYIINLESYITA